MARVRPGRGQLARALDAPIQPGLRSLKKRKGSSEARGNRCQQLQPGLPVPLRDPGPPAGQRSGIQFW